MNNRHEMNEEIGIVKWFGDSTKEGSQSNYGYIERSEKPGYSDIKVHWKGLSCSLDEIKWKKGLLVRFQIGTYRGKEEAINVEPIRLLGYVDWYGNVNRQTEQLNEFGYIVIDITVLIGERVGYIVAKSKHNKSGQDNPSLEKNIESLELNEKSDYSVRINKHQLSCSEASLVANTAVCFGIEKNYQTNKYEALRLSLLEDEENQETLELGTHSQKLIILQTAFRKYLTLFSEEEAVKFAIKMVNNSSGKLSEKNKIDFINSISDHLKSRLDARLLREVLPAEFRLRIYHAMVANYQANELSTHNVEEEIINTLTNLPTAQMESWFNSNVESKVIYNGFLWRIATEGVKRRIIEEKFDSFLSVIKSFNSGYKYEKSVTASAEDCYSNLDQKDWQLAREWISSEEQNNKHILAQMLSARAGEKFAIKFYQSLGYQVEDVSLQQISSNNRDWCNSDLLLNDRISVDIKNSRTDVNNKNGYSKFCVPRFKKNRSNNEVIIAGVLSPYLQLEYIELPKKATFSIPPFIFMGEIKKSQLDIIEQHFSPYFYSIRIPRVSGEKYLPPWLFDYKTKVFYTYQKEAISKLKKLTPSELPEWDELPFLKMNPIPLYIAAKISLPEKWKVYLSSYQKSFISRFEKIQSERITLPYLFLTLLSHFLDMLRSNEDSFHPQKYSDLLYCEEEGYHPLGIYDPLNIIREFCETLSLLWDNRYQSRIAEFKIFEFDGRGLLQGKRDSSERLTTIIAYCGGFVEKKGQCGFTPLILGKHNHCLNCGKLICPKCNYCSKNCQQRLERQRPTTTN